MKVNLAVAGGIILVLLLAVGIVSTIQLQAEHVEKSDSSGHNEITEPGTGAYKENIQTTTSTQNIKNASNHE
jgi:Tfp pilus assembly protein PilV